MPMLHGCTGMFDSAFANHHQMQIYQMGPKETIIIKGDLNVHVNYVQGDCTAATLYFEEAPPTNCIKTFFPILIQYLSANARISAFFSFKVWKGDLANLLKELRKFHIAGLNVQKSNRNPTDNTWQVSGLLKVTNPFIKSYDQTDGNQLVQLLNHPHNDAVDYNLINKEHKCKTFRK